MSPGLVHVHFSGRKRDGRGLPGVVVQWKGLMCVRMSVCWEAECGGLAGSSPSPALLPTGSSRVSVSEPEWTGLSWGGEET